MAAPGLKKEVFNINVDIGVVTVSYEKKTERETKDYKTHRREYSVSSFSRSFTLDDNINADGIQAKYEDGVLKLYLPKKEEVKITPKEITIQ
jgi:HSP20 family protein